MKHILLFGWLFCISSLRHSSPNYLSPSLYRSRVSSISQRAAKNSAYLENAIAYNLVNKFKKAVAVGVIGFSSLFGFTLSTLGADSPYVLDEVWGIVNENFVDSTYNGNDWSKIKSKYDQRLQSGANEDDLIKSMLKLLGDKYTRLLDKQFFEALWKYDAIGIGILFQSVPNGPMLVASPPISGSSGEQAGIHKGDVIYNINGRTTDKMTAMEVLDMMSNDESDTVKLVYSHGINGDKKEVELVRSKQKATNPVTYFSDTINNEKIGYLRLKEFNSDAVPMLRNAILDLEKQGCQKYVLDLRGNTGGGFQFALNIGGMFMNNKQMVTALGKQNDKSIFVSSYPNGVLTNKPLVLWVDGLSASASEVLAGGLHDNCRATVVGEKTFGKGKIQAVFGLSNGEGITLTVAQYITPNGNIIQSKGIVPDIPIASLSPYLKLVVDPLLSAPDLSQIDFKKTQKIIDMCEANNRNSLLAPSPKPSNVFPIS